MTTLTNYLTSTFLGLQLKPSLYHQWDKGIHFELGEGVYQLQDGSDKLNLDRFNNAHRQTTAIFNELFSEKDDLFLVTNLYVKNTRKNQLHKTGIYDRYLKNKALRFQLTQETLPHVFDDEEDAGDYYTSRLAIRCRKQDIHYKLLIQAACHEDFPLKPKFGGRYGSYYPDVFFINMTKNCIFFIYDDRGCEVLAKDLETIRPLYEKYRNWIDEYYLEEIDQRFA